MTHYAQLARGYSLLVLCGIAATAVLLRLSDGNVSRRTEIAYVVIATVGLASHLYMAIVLAGHVGLIIARRQLSPTWLVRWSIATAMALLMIMQAFPARRPGPFRPSFPVDTAYEVLGANPVSATVFGAASLAALVAYRRYALTALLPLGLFVTIWVGLHPLDLYPRFFVIFVPAVATAAAYLASKNRWTIAPILVACALVVPTAPPSDSGIRDTAQILTAAEAQGTPVCAVGSEALLAYTVVPEFSADRACDMVALIGSWEPSGLPEARVRLDTSISIGDVEILGATTP